MTSGVTAPKRSAAAGRTVLQEVLRHGPLARSELAHRLRLSPPSLTRLTAPLIKAGLLNEVDARPTVGAGRPSRPLDVVPDAGHFAGVKLTEDEAYGVVTDLRAGVLATADRKLPSHDVQAVVQTIVDVLADLDVAAHRVAHLGVSLGGDTRDRRTVSRSVFLEWHQVQLATLVEEAVGVPTVIDNDLVALTMAEHWFGAGRGRERFALVTIGAGVGYGLVMHDQVVESTDAGVGLLGHQPLDHQGPRCPQGHRGCATSMLTIPAITSAVSVGLGRPVTYRECLALAAQGDPVADPIIRDAARALGRLLATVANIAMTRHIILAGDGVAFMDVARDVVREELALARDPEADPIELDVQTFGFTEWARGAAVAAIQRWALVVNPVAP